jgi:uncharacterized protein
VNQPDARPRSAAILALTGGGMLARFTVEVLQQLEGWRRQVVGATTAHGGLADAFDLLAGTSSGALLAAGLAVGRQPADMARLMDEHGPRIFPPASGIARLRWLWRARYPLGPLQDAVAAALGGASPELGEIAHHLILPVVDERSERPVIFSSRDPAHARVRLVDAVIASAAAPTYFPAHHVAVLGRAFVDGGLYANAPDVAALAALRAGWPRLELDRISLVSIGTSVAAETLHPAHPDRGIWQWAVRPSARLLKLTLRTQLEHTVSILPLLGLADTIRIDQRKTEQATLFELDDASAAARRTLAEAGRAALDAQDIETRARLRVLVGRNRWHFER